MHDGLHGADRARGDRSVGIMAIASSIEPTAIQQVHFVMERALLENDLAKAAIDIACHDLPGKLIGVPVYELLGVKVRNEVRLTWTIGLGTINAMVAEAVEWAEGFAINVKIGVDPEQDLKNVIAIPQAIGELIPIGGSMWVQLAEAWLETPLNRST